MPDQKVRQQLEEEVARLRDLAIRSIDPLIVAKAIAASDPGVQQLILKRLEKGEQLVEVFSFPGVETRETQVFFRFVPAKQLIHMVDTGVLVFVDSTRGDVIGTIDPFSLQPEQRVGRPLVAISPVDTSKFSAPADTTKQISDREESFFEGMGLGSIAQRRRYTIGTVIDTIFGTESWSGTPRQPDDTRSDRTQDYRDQITIESSGTFTV